MNCCGVVLTQLVPNVPTSSCLIRSHLNQWHQHGIVKGVDTAYQGVSLLMHVFGKGLVWVSDFRPQRLHALWSQRQVEDRNLLTEQALNMSCIQCYQPIGSVKGYTAYLCFRLKQTILSAFVFDLSLKGQFDMRRLMSLSYVHGKYKATVRRWLS